MKVKIYLGKDGVEQTLTQMNTVRYKLEGTGNPSNGTRFEIDIISNSTVLMNINKTFDASASTLTLSTRGANQTDTVNNLVTNLQTYNNLSDPLITYSVSTGVNGFGYKDIYIDVELRATDVASINIPWNNTSSFNIAAPTIISAYTAIQTNSVTNYLPIDLYQDENVELTSKLSDIEKLSNVFLDFSNSFTVPATANNSELFKHYYDVDIDNTFNANIRALGYVEIDSLPFRYGKIQLEGITLKNQKPDSYKITFYGGLIQLSDLFSDDIIAKLDYAKNFDTGVTDATITYDSLSKFNYENTEANFLDSLTDADFSGGDIMTPLIAYTNRDWNYGNGDTNTDISTVSVEASGGLGAILDTELKPAIRAMRIIEAIETKYDISFSRQFFGKAMFNNLYMWMNSSDKIKQSNRVIVDNALVDELSPSSTDVVTLSGDYASITTYKYNQGHGANVEQTYFATFDFFIYPDSGFGDVDFTVRFIDAGNNIVREIAKDDLAIGNTLARFTARSIPNSGDNDETIEHKIRIEIVSNYSFSYSVDFRGYHSYYITNNAGGTITTILEQRISTSNTNVIAVYQKPELLLPNIRVIDWFQGIMKMFKLVIRPISGNQFYVNTLDGYYGDGNILDITNYVNETDINVERPLIYKTINFKYEKTNNVLGKKYREDNDPSDEIGYGDLKSIQPYVESKESLNVTLPFENMLFENMSILYPTTNYGNPTNIIIGQSMSLSDSNALSPNNSKPIFFFNNGIGNNYTTPYCVKFRTNVTSLVTNFIIGNTNDELLVQVTDTINWGAEVDPWHNQIVGNSLYLNYWSNWVQTIYDTKQRKFTFEANLPPRYVQELSLNDRLIIGNNRYKINDYKLNLTNGNTKFTLFKDIYQWSEFTFPDTIIDNSFSFTPNGWYYTDFASNDTQAVIYGSFTGYNGTTYGHVIRLNDDTSVDPTFNTSNAGFNFNTYAFQSVLEQPDGKYMYTGDFTLYNGTAANRIVRTFSDGTLDGTFVYGTGFNNLTSRIKMDSQGKYLVCGSYSSYDGNTANRFIRLESNGSVDTSFLTNLGTGFNNVTNDVIVNSDDSMYVSGYFTSFNGTANSHLIKLTSGGTIDTSFTNYGFTVPTNSPVAMVESNGLIAYGYFTQYSGQSANRICKLNSDGTLDPIFLANIGTGFNGNVYFGKVIFGNKILLEGFFTSYNGITSKGVIILNNDGTIYRAFDTAYVNVFNIGSKLYGNVANGPVKLILDENVLPMFTSTIIMNAGAKYFGINTITKKAWSVSNLIDLGYGVDWVEVETPSGIGSSEIVIKVLDKTNQTAPNLYITRRLSMLITIDDIKYGITITQNGLQQ